MGSGWETTLHFIQSGDQPVQDGGPVSEHRVGVAGACKGLEGVLRCSRRMGRLGFGWGKGPCSMVNGSARSTGLHTLHPMVGRDAFPSAFDCKTRLSPPATARFTIKPTKFRNLCLKDH